MLRILTTDSHTFFFVVMLYGIALIVAICILFFAVQIIVDLIARHRFKSFRKGHTWKDRYHE